MHGRRLRSSYILDLVRNGSNSNHIQENESIVIGHSPVRMGESDFNALEALVDDELSSNRPWSPDQSVISFSHLEARAATTDSDNNSVILDSNEDTPIPSPTQPSLDINLQPLPDRPLSVAIDSPQVSINRHGDNPNAFQESLGEPSADNCFTDKLIGLAGLEGPCYMCTESTAKRGANEVFKTVYKRQH